VLLDEVEDNSDQEAENTPMKYSKKDSEDIFCKIDSSSLKVAETYTMKWGNGVEDAEV
jgi:hypothetical protein